MNTNMRFPLPCSSAFLRCDPTLECRRLIGGRILNIRTCQRPSSSTTTSNIVTDNIETDNIETDNIETDYDA
ncbi:hypothetical protein NPIL_81421 [Nephila pilipes]|uniref:Uncharacterized protein n=1 Tax=Nephila pilipes TaxID=299642 RepID=A0A8X6JUN4_NEPPI|nr:hypothetical protein NPIL_81421 [Nephila pilipes]